MSRAAYNAPACGARCDECVLRGRVVVPPEGPGKLGGATSAVAHTSARIAIVGDFPVDEDVQERRPFVSPAGSGVLTPDLAAAGMPRGRVWLTPAMLCQPLDNNLEYTIREARRRGMLDPLEACRPRLVRELADFKYVVPVGGTAAKAVLPHVRAGILSIWGSHVELPESLEILNDEPVTSCARKVLPTVSPAFVAKQASRRPKFQHDLAKAMRWFRGKLNWVEPVRTFCPTPRELREWLKVPTPYHAWDLESPWHERRLQDPLRCGIERFGLADAAGDRAICVPFMHIGGGTEIYTKRNGMHRDFPYSARDLEELRKILTDFLLDPSRPKVGWNSGYFDALVTEAAWGVVPVKHADAIGIHHNIEPELPHTLAFAGSIYTDVHGWKVDAEGAKLAKGARTDEEKCEYCMTDCAVTARAFAAMRPIAQQRGRVPTIQVEARIQAEVCRELHKVGMPLDRRDKIRYKWEKTYDEKGKVTGSKRVPLNALAWHEQLTAQAVNWLRIARQELVKDDVALRGILDEGAAKFTTVLDSADFWKDDPLGAIEGRYDPERAKGADYSSTDVGATAFDALDVLRRAGVNTNDPMLNFNPGSPHQLRSILFDQWGMTIPGTVPRRVGYTSSGEPSTGDAVLIAMLCDRGLPAARLRFLEAVRGYRKAIKLRGTYVKGALLDFNQGGYWWEEDGRVRSTWNSHVTGPGRLSSSGPNLQNVRALLRTMYRAKRGRIMGGADASQIHLRIIAARWGVARLLECFEQDGDPHAVAALAAFGDRFRNAAGWPAGSDPARGIVGKGGKWSGKAKEYRQIAKILQYAAAYGADAKTIHQVLLSTEDSDGNLTNLDMTIDEVRLYHRSWLEGMPEFAKGWDAEMSHWRTHGYVEEPVTGRRCWFTDGEDFNAIVNWPILASEAAIMHLATLRLIEQIPFGKWGPGTGLINQCHDSLTVETIDTLDGKLVREVADTVAWAIAQPVPAYSQVRFTADPCWGKTWADA